MPVASAVAVAALVGEEFAVQAFCQFFLGGITHRYDLAGEVQGLACHRGVEVHGHLVVLDFDDHAVAYFSRRIEHGDEFTGFQQVFPELAVDLERTLRYVEDLGQVVFAIGVLRGDGAAERLSFLLSFQLGFQHGDDHPHALDVVQGLFLRGPVDHLAFNFNLVAYRHNFHRFNLHICYSPEKSTFSNAKVGISFDLQSLASSPTARRPFQRVTRLPVMSISLTGRTIFPSLNSKPSMPKE